MCCRYLGTREGAKTLLIEAMGQLGGMGTAGMVPAWCPFSDGEKIIYRGLAEKIFEASRKGVPHERKQKMNWVSINPEYLMTVYDQMVTESGARVLFFSRVAAVEKAADETVDAIIVANKSGLVAFKAKVLLMRQVTGIWRHGQAHHSREEMIVGWYRAHLYASRLLMSIAITTI